MESAIFLPSANQLGNFNVKSDTFSKTFPPHNQLGQIFEKTQKFLTPSLISWEFFKAIWSKFLKQNKKVAKQHLKKMSYDDFRPKK